MFRESRRNLEFLAPSKSKVVGRSVPAIAISPWIPIMKRRNRSVLQRHEFRVASPAPSSRVVSVLTLLLC